MPIFNPKSTRNLFEGAVSPFQESFVAYTYMSFSTVPSCILFHMHFWSGWRSQFIQTQPCLNLISICTSPYLHLYPHTFPLKDIIPLKEPFKGSLGLPLSSPCTQARRVSTAEKNGTAPAPTLLQAGRHLVLEKRNQMSR